VNVYRDRLRGFEELFGLPSEAEVLEWQRAAAAAMVKRRCPDAPLILTMLGLT